MPLVRISLRQGGPPGRGRAVGDAVHQAMVETIGVPPLDRFQVITEHPAEGLVYDPAYLDIQRSDEVVLVQITLNAGRTLEQKKALYARIAALARERAGVRPEDVLVNLVEVARENWSFGNGMAQYAS
ncbi:MAG TPA: tautomerase family protein [Anaeromyxobacteraceae bacterium]|nr:tautomerase family protein [Anaeromyxobacteraceae bacterium]